MQTEQAVILPSGLAGSWRPVLIPIEVVAWAWGVRAGQILECIESGQVQAWDVRSGGPRAEWRIWSGTILGARPGSIEEMIGYRLEASLRLASVERILWVGRPHIYRLVESGELQAERDPLRIRRDSLVAFLRSRASV